MRVDVRGARARDAASIIHRRVVVDVVVVDDEVVSRDDASIRAAFERVSARDGARWIISASSRAPSRRARARIHRTGRRG